MPSIRDVAELAGVSTATVSRVLSGSSRISEQTAIKVQAAAEQLGYVVSSSASSLASGRTKTIGVVTPILNRWYFGEILEGIQSELMANGYDLTLYNLGGDDSQRGEVFDHFLHRKRVDAVIAVSLELTQSETAKLLAIKKPIVGLGGPIAEVPTLSIDDVEVAKQATKILIDHGHKTIDHLGGDHRFERDFHVPTSRLNGYRQAMTEAGLPLSEANYHTTDFSVQGGYEAAMNFLKQRVLSGVTAIFCASDEMAIGLMFAAAKLGMSIPEELSVIGIDGHELGEFLGLTTIAQHPRLQGKKSVELLIKQLNSAAIHSEQLHQSFEVTPVIRESVAELNQAKRGLRSSLFPKRGVH